MQVLDKRAGRNVLLRSFGSSKDEGRLRELETLASEYISIYGGQGILDLDTGLPPSKGQLIEDIFSSIVDIRQDSTATWTLSTPHSRN